MALTSSAADAERSPGPGRPRDPEVDARVMEAAIRVYAREGWAGFTIGKVAAEAGTGKSPIYRRWPDKHGLLVAALEQAGAYFTHTRSSSELPFAEYLTEMMRYRLSRYFSEVGAAIVRLNAEHMSDPEGTADLWSGSQGRGALEMRRLLEAAKDEGLLRPDTSITHLADVLEGSILVHAIAVPTHLRERAIAGIDRYVDGLIERSLWPWLTEAGRAGGALAPAAG